MSDVETEQAHVDRAYTSLAAMRAKSARLLAEVRAAGGVELEHVAALARRVALLAEGARPLCFGRIDEAGGQTWHIGRRHVEDDAGEPVVVEWRTPIAAPFYQARPSQPLGLRRRRQLLLEGRTVLAVADDTFDGADGADPLLRGGDALLAELERARTGEMLDIVATIQAEQDDVIRAPLAGVLAVQGGPGTGKTAIGLHRVAYLLYNHPELARSGVLVVGPSRTFLRYIAQVLPSLGEEAVTQVTVEDLVPAVRVRAVEPLAVARLKGDARMAEVLARALAARRRLAADDLIVPIGLARLRTPAAKVNAVVEGLAARPGPYLAGRAAARDRLIALVYREWLASPVLVDTGDPQRRLASSPKLKAALDGLWPSVSAPALVNDLLTGAERIAHAAAGVLDAQEQELLLRGAAPSLGRAPWTAADAALVDEAHALLHGPGRTYGHVVVDEAQDLSPMQLRMLARRAPAGSVTVLGDLAQATGPWAHRSWGEVVDTLPRPSGWREAELTLGYRAPRQVIELASRLLAQAAPSVRPTSSVRVGRRPPLVAAVAPDQLFRAMAGEARRLAAEGFLVGCIVADEHLGAAAAALRSERAPFGTAERDGLAQPITLLAAPGAKGLEFDAAVVVEPAAIAGDGGGPPTPRGLRLLYVALTRPIQHLSVVHSRPLPGGLGDPLPACPACPACPA